MIRVRFSKGATALRLFGSMTEEVAFGEGGINTYILREQPTGLLFAAEDKDPILVSWSAIDFVVGDLHGHASDGAKAQSRRRKG